MRVTQYELQLTRPQHARRAITLRRDGPCPRPGRVCPALTAGALHESSLKAFSTRYMNFVIFVWSAPETYWILVLGLLGGAAWEMGMASQWHQHAAFGVSFGYRGGWPRPRKKLKSHTTVSLSNHASFCIERCGHTNGKTFVKGYLAWVSQSVAQYLGTLSLSQTKLPCMGTYIYIYIYLYTYTLYGSFRRHICICIHVYTSRISVYVCIYVYSMYICICICEYTHICDHV